MPFVLDRPVNGLLEFNANTVRKFSPTGTDLGVFASAGLDGPQGLAFDYSGNLYVANRFVNTIRKFSSTGTDLGVFAGTGANILSSGLAFAPIPEPSTIVLAGFGLVGLIAWRVRRRRE